MRKSLGSTKPKGVMKVKASHPRQAQVGSRPSGPGALPARLVPCTFLTPLLGGGERIELSG